MSALAYGGEVFKVRFAETQLQHTNTVLNVEAQGVRDIPEETRALPVITGSARMPLREGVHVKVGPARPDGTPHPHVGKTGRVTRFINSYTDPYWVGLPTAMIKLDSGIKSQGFIWVALGCLEALPESARDADS